MVISRERWWENPRSKSPGLLSELTEAWLSLLPLGVERATHLRPLRASHCWFFSLQQLCWLPHQVINTACPGTSLLLTSYCISHEIVMLLVWLASCHSGIPFPPPLALPTCWNTARTGYRPELWIPCLDEPQECFCG